jgi:hypothetical protein
MATRIVVELWVDGVISDGQLESIAKRASEDIFRVNNDPVLFIRDRSVSFVEDLDAQTFADEYVEQVNRNIVVPAHYKQTARASVYPTESVAPISLPVSAESAAGFNPSTGEAL